MFGLCCGPLLSVSLSLSCVSLFFLTFHRLIPDAEHQLNPIINPPDRYTGELDPEIHKVNPFLLVHIPNIQT